jgi:hypothetical protein
MLIPGVYGQIELSFACSIEKWHPHLPIRQRESIRSPKWIS